MTIRERTMKMLNVLKSHIEQTGKDKYKQLDLPEPFDVIANAQMGEEFLWGEMYKRLHEIAVAIKWNRPFERHMLKLLHEGLALLSVRHPELIEEEKGVNQCPRPEN